MSLKLKVYERKNREISALFSQAFDLAQIAKEGLQASCLLQIQSALNSRRKRSTFDKMAGLY